MLINFYKYKKVSQTVHLFHFDGINANILRRKMARKS